jgi:hypothetical protein
MKISIFYFLLAMIAYSVPAHACDGPLGTRPTKAGGTMQVCLEPKYSTCIANNRKGVWSPEEAKARCDQLRASGKIS